MVILAYLKLIRWPILLLIAAIQFSIRYFLIAPMIGVNGFELIMTDREFGYLVLATLLIAGGGHAINDYFDAKIDRINKPKTAVLDRLIKRRVAMALHAILSGSGILIASYLSYKMGMWKMSALFIFVIFSLWIYSTQLKNQLLIGNLLIALLAGFVPLIVGLYEIPLLNASHPDALTEVGDSLFNAPAFWIIGYSCFIALFTLAREITKDVIDLRGDKYYDFNTLPIALGIPRTKGILIFIYLVIGAAITWIYSNFFVGYSDLLSACSLAILVILFIQITMLIRAKTKKQFLNSANLNNLATIILVASIYFLKLFNESYFA
jgi:4-hydroxybenzoate polyprenyltransferase